MADRLSFAGARRDVMRAIHVLKKSFHAVARRVAAARTRPAFYCGQCERWERCGLPPSEDCIVRLAQIERDGGRPRKVVGQRRRRYRGSNGLVVSAATV